MKLQEVSALIDLATSQQSQGSSIQLTSSFLFKSLGESFDEDSQMRMLLSIFEASHPVTLQTPLISCAGASPTATRSAVPNQIAVDAAIPVLRLFNIPQVLT